MNQILVTEKIYVTPELKRKKRFFKIEFFLSVFLLCFLSSYCIYAQYDRNKSEEVSKEILSKMEYIDTTVVQEESVVVVLNSALENNQEVIDIDEASQSEIVEIPEEQKVTTNSGTVYYTIGRVVIDKINVDYPILDSDSADFDTLLKIAPCKFWGSNPNEVGNLCIAGHNYRTSQFFSKVPKLEKGDIIKITDLTGRTIEYSVYDKYTVEPTDTSCTSQLTDGKKEVTLITCTNDNKKRVIVKARAIE